MQVYELTSHDTPHCFKRNVWHVWHRTTAWHSKAYTVLPRPNFSALGLGFLDISTKSCFAKWQHIQRRMGRMTAVRWKCHLDQHHHHHRHRHPPPPLQESQLRNLAMKAEGFEAHHSFKVSMWEKPLDLGWFLYIFVALWKEPGTHSRHAFAILSSPMGWLRPEHAAVPFNVRRG